MRVQRCSQAMPPFLSVNNSSGKSCLFLVFGLSLEILDVYAFFFFLFFFFFFFFKINVLYVVFAFRLKKFPTTCYAYWNFIVLTNS